MHDRSLSQHVTRVSYEDVELDPDQPIIYAHQALPTGVVLTYAVAYTFGEDGTPELPFTSLDGTLFLVDLRGDLIAMSMVHKIEGLL